MKRRYVECNFDGLAGPTHNYSGLSFGNIASMKNRNITSNPREAALQCLHKMAYLMRLGVVQGILPPHERPYLPLLRDIGFRGSDREVSMAAQKEAPHIFYACCSSSPMWTANAATFTPSVDAADSRAHITPANLVAEFHRSFEKMTTTKVIKKIFSSEDYFVCHPPLPSTAALSDEGAANHTRFCSDIGEKGVHLFVYGKKSFIPTALQPSLYPARQALEASQAVARSHLIDSERLLFAQQHPDAIDAGIFHNDVASVGYKNLFLAHEKAFVDGEFIFSQIREKMEKLCSSEFILIALSENELPLDLAVKSYLFNSQIVETKEGEILLIAPGECQSEPVVKGLLDAIVGDSGNPIAKVHTTNLVESMQNGGGPACLRLRLPLSSDEIDALHPECLLTESLYQKLLIWVERHYRDSLSQKDLSDPLLLEESQRALDELTSILNLGPLYSFQQE